MRSSAQISDSCRRMWCTARSYQVASSTEDHSNENDWASVGSLPLGETTKPAQCPVEDRWAIVDISYVRLQNSQDSCVLTPGFPPA